MRSGAVAASEDVPEIRFHHDARGVVFGEAAQFLCEPLSGSDDGGDEILKGLSLHRHGILMPLDGVIPGGEGAADDLRATGFKGVGFLLPRVDDDGDPVHVRTVPGRYEPPSRIRLRRLRARCAG